MSDGASVEVGGSPGNGSSQEKVESSSVGNDAPGTVSVQAILEAAAAAENKPKVCGSCEERPPSVLTTLPGYVSKAGIPIPIWLCQVCVELIPENRVPRKKSKKRSGRLSAGKFGKAVMGLAYRYGGFTASQLGEMLLRQNPSRFARSRTTPEKAAFASARDTLLLLRENRLMDSVGIWREHAVGERGGRIEEFYHLSPKGVYWGASENDVVDGTEAKEAYQRHQLPKEAEHAAYRNDIYLWMLRDFEVERRLHDDDEEMLARYASEVVVSTLKDFTGESDERYPYRVGALKNAGGASLGKEKPLRGRTSEWLYPDGHPRIVWADGFVGEFEVEAERESKAVKAARKVDRYGAYWLRLYKEMEEAWREPQLRPLEEELAGVEAKRKQLVRDGYSLEKLKKSSEHGVGVLRKLRQEIEKVNASHPEFLGLPEMVAPVVFIHQTKQRSENTRQKLRDREYPMPRYDEFLTYMAARMKGWARDTLLAGNKKRIAAGAEPVSVDFGAYATTFLDTLFIFTSWEELREVDEESEEEKKRKLRERMERLRAEDFEGEDEELHWEAQRQLDEESAPEILPGRTLWAIYTTLHAKSEAGGMSLREVSGFRKKLKPGEVAKVSPNT